MVLKAKVVEWYDEVGKEFINELRVEVKSEVDGGKRVE